MPSTRAAAVVRACGLDEIEAARRSRERRAPVAKPTRAKISLAALPKTMRLDKGDFDATDQRIAHARADGLAIGKLGPARHISSPFATLAKRQYLNPGSSRADVALNDALFAAGVKYAQAFEGAGMGVLRAHAMGERLARTTASSATTSEHALACRKRVDEAREVIGPRMIGLVDAVVLDGKTLTSLSGLYGTSKDVRVAQTEVRVMFVEALHQLVRFWSMFDYRALEAA